MIVDFMLEKGVLVEASIFDNIKNETKAEILNVIKNNVAADELCDDFYNDFMERFIFLDDGQNISTVFDLDKDESENCNSNGSLFLKTKTIEKSTVLDSDVTKNVEVLSKKSDKIDEEFIEGSVDILFSYRETNKKKNVNDFVSLFNSRYKQIKNMFIGRTELQGLSSISRIIGKKDENVAIIGLISEKEQTKNGNFILTLEDPTGIIKVLVTQKNSELFEFTKNLVYDEVVAVTGQVNENIIFANNILQPDIPMTKELKKCNDDIYAIFLSDIHVGSNNFLEDKFDKFISWLNGEIGTEAHKQLVKKIKYVFIAGDLVDGIGIYPGQDEELVVKDIHEQYKICAQKLAKFPKHMKIIVAPGNHDAMRLSEPQPVLYEDYAKEMHQLPNVTLISNPGVVRIHRTKDFPGFDVLLYHGSSFDYYFANVDELRQNGGYDRPDLLMTFLLKRRHLAPAYGSTTYLPDYKKDYLVIEYVPDFFVTGHIHKSIIANYRNVTMISCSCWQKKTAYEEKLGHNPEPARVPLVSLKTRQSKILKF